MATKTFFKGSMACEDIKSFVGSARFMINGEVAPIHDGAFVKLGDLIEDEIYGDIDYNVYEAAAPAAATDKVVVLDYAGISEGSIIGNDYKIGTKLYNLVCPAGRNCRFRRMVIGDKFWLTDGLFDGDAEVGKYAGLKANDTILALADEQPAAGFAVKILAEAEMTTGQIANGKRYLVEVIAL